MRKTVSKKIRNLSQQYNKKYETHYEVVKVFDRKFSGFKLVRQEMENSIVKPFAPLQGINLPEAPKGIDLSHNYKSFKKTTQVINHYKKLKKYYIKYGAEKFQLMYMKFLVHNYKALQFLYPDLFVKKA